MKSAAGALRLAVDVGGTFTDIVAHDTWDGSLRFEKVPTTPENPCAGVLDAFTQADAPAGRAEYFAHGTTLGLNALLTRAGAKTALVTTQGFRDVYLLGRTDRAAAYDFRYKKPASLIARRLIFEVPERLNFRGEVLCAFDRVSAQTVAREIDTLCVESVAVCFLHSYVNPLHEIAMAEVLAANAPRAHVILSHSLTREYREYERTSTTVLDAYIRPLLRDYIGELEERLCQERFSGRFFMIRSGGGAMTADRARDAPVNLILSGPAGGVLGAASFGAATNEPNLITIDMGGTSLDASLIVGGEPVVQHEAGFQGLPMMVASLYINTIGAGGGSLVWVDGGGHLQVGPGSAGAVPGPAAYGNGGMSATVTDAALVCGYLGTETALAGTLFLDAELARSALAPSARALGTSVDHVAYGVIRIAVTKIVGAIRAITVEMGYRPADFALLAFGGAGGLVAAEVARELSIGRVIVPPGPGSFSALGMLMADVQHDFAQTRVSSLETSQAASLEREFSTMEKEAFEALAADSFPPDRCRLYRLVDLRYRGQEHSVSVPAAASVDAEEVERLGVAFHGAHELRYGHALSDPIEVVTVRTRATGLVERPELPTVAVRSSGLLMPVTRRSVYQETGDRRDYAVYYRDAFRFEDRIVGPAVVNEHTSTTILHEGDVAVVGRLGELHVEVSGV